MKTAIEVFSDWVDIGKDEGMQRNHWNAVKKMFQLLSVNIITIIFNSTKANISTMLATSTPPNPGMIRRRGLSTGVVALTINCDIGL